MPEESERQLLLVGASIIDGVSERPIEGQALLISGNRIAAVGKEKELPHGLGVEVVDLTGKYLIPGLMDANLHLMGDVRLENLIRFEGRYQEIIVEAAQITLKGGLTTVFDTWGPRHALMEARDAVERGEVVGSRIFCAGNIVGLDGPISRDFYAKSEAVSAPLAERINATWAENVGPALSWMLPEQVAAEIQTYMDTGVDFIKYASSEHRWGDPSAFLLFSPRVQRAIVDATHSRGLTVQSHTTAIESLHAALESGCDIIQHCNLTGHVAIPEDMLETFCRKGVGAVIFPLTQRRFEWVMNNCKLDAPYFRTSDENVRNLMRVGANLLLCTDSMLLAPDAANDPLWSNFWTASGDDNLGEFGRGHFVWFEAMEEKGYPAIEILRAGTRNIAKAYGKDKDLGSLEVGKIADILALDANPLVKAKNYRSISMIIKDGKIIDHSRLPIAAIQTKAPRDPSSEVLAYRAHRHIGKSAFPMCGCFWEHR